MLCQIVNYCTTYRLHLSSTTNNIQSHIQLHLFHRTMSNIPDNNSVVVDDSDLTDNHDDAVVVVDESVFSDHDDDTLEFSIDSDVTDNHHDDEYYTNEEDRKMPAFKEKDRKIFSHGNVDFHISQFHRRFNNSDGSDGVAAIISRVSTEFYDITSNGTNAMNWKKFGSLCLGLFNCTPPIFQYLHGIKNSKESPLKDIIAEATLDTFTVGQKYTIDDLKARLNEFGDQYFFKIVRGGKKFHCYRGFATKNEIDRHRYKDCNEPQRNYATRMKCNCNWFISFVREVKDMVRITKISPTHTNGCKPSAKEMLAVVPRSTQPRKIDPKILLHLVLCRSRRNVRLSSDFIRSELQLALPNSMYVSANAILYLKDKIEKLFKEKAYVGENGYEALKAAIEPEQWLSGLNSCLDEYVSPYQKHLDHIAEMLSDATKADFYRLERTLQLVGIADATFLFQLAKNSSNETTGAVWQTGVMRGNFERFGNYLSVDTMHRDLNKDGWVYLAGTILNELNESQVCIECIALGERQEVYDFMLEHLIKFSPGMPIENVHCVSSDAFLGKAYFKKFFPEAKYIRDRYHLLENIKKNVTLHRWQKFKAPVMELLNSKSERQFNSYFNEVLRLCNGNDSLRTYFQKLGRQRDTYAKYLLVSNKGNYNLHGSVISEQNNHSVLSFIKDITSTRSLDELLILFLKRQKMKELKSNKTMMENSLELNGLHDSATNEWSRHASKKLALLTYNRLCTHVMNSSNYEVSRDPNGSYRIQRLDSIEASPRMITDERDHCSCFTRVSYLMPCSHEIALRSYLRKNIFELRDFHQRHHRKEGVYVSHNIGTNKNDYTSLNDLSSLRATFAERLHSDNFGDDDSVAFCLPVADGDTGDTDDDQKNSSSPLMLKKDDDDQTSSSALMLKNSCTVTWVNLRDAGIAVANEAEKWNNNVKQMCLGLFSRVLQKLRNPNKHANATYLAESVQSYAQTFLDCLRPEFRSKSNGGNQKRKKSINESVSMKKRKVEEDETNRGTCFSQTSKGKQKGCSACGQWFSSGHHTKSNCPNK